MKALSSKTKKLILIGVAALALIGGAAWYFLRGGSAGGTAVYVTPVSSGAGWSYGGTNRYNGVVEPQATVDVTLDSSKTLKEIFVKEGDAVKKGDPLFSYDTNAMKLELSQLQVDVQRIANEIDGNNARIAQLQAEKASAPADQQIEYTLNIQSLQTATQSLQYSLKAKKNEVSQKQESIKNADVPSPIDGTIKTINQNGGEGAFMTVMETGEFLVKGTINEMNISQLSVGAAVVVRSRIDDTVWYGSIRSIDTSRTAQNSGGYYYYGSSDSSQQSSKYNFFVSLDDASGLFLGQHVTIALDDGTADDGALRVSEAFIVDAETAPYVWKDDGGRLVKQSLKLGGYSAETGEYIVLEGLTDKDYVAFPAEDLREGMKTTTEYVMPDDLGGDVLPAEGEGVYGDGLEDGELPGDGLGDGELPVTDGGVPADGTAEGAVG